MQSEPDVDARKDPSPGSDPSRGAGPGSVFKHHGIALLGLFLKLLKTAKVLKVGLLGLSVGAYGLIFSWQFAAVLIGITVFHEYGHLRAMKRFGLPVKGMYLIPFVGGVAVGGKPRSRWQNVYISMMGPVFGLFMTVGFFVAWLLTANHFAGLVATFSALLNVFNLLPVLPLDGGHVFKSMALSFKGRYGLLFLTLFSAACFALAWLYGFYFLCFFIFIGAIDLAATWRNLSRERDLQTPLTLYGIAFSAGWYLAVTSALLAMIVIIVKNEVPGAEIVLKILMS